MNAAVRALLNQVIDYAGLFPPAKLPLEEALRVYQDAKKNSPHRWMLGSFVCPVARLGDLPAPANGTEDTARLHLTALGQQAATEAEFLPRLEADLAAIRNFRRLRASSAAIDVMEVAVPRGANLEALLAHLPGVAAKLQEAGLRCFFEIPVTPNWSSDVEKLSDFLRLTPQPGIGLKLRCGGLSADAFPDRAAIALFIDRCRKAGVPWKATAGLHHARAHWDEALQVWHHGFLNVFIAGVMARIHALPEEFVLAILCTGVTSQFRFDNGRLAWKTWSCTPAQIAAARTDFATSFGSCSFEEPCSELTALGLVDAPSRREPDSDSARHTSG
jgi:hypothetical protein